MLVKKLPLQGFVWLENSGGYYGDRFKIENGVMFGVFCKDKMSKGYC